MKNLIISFCLSFIGVAGYSQSDVVATVDIKTIISCDHCLRCGSCSPRLQKAIRTNKGIKSVNIDADQNVITVKYRTDKATLADIRKSITEAGFDADDLKAKLEAYEELDACCKKPEDRGR